MADSVSGVGQTNNAYNAVFTDKKDKGVKVEDFLNLMVAQLRNQDFMNPVDDTQFVSQMATFATMQQMQEMAEYMKTNYVLSLVGQEVTAARFTVSGNLEKVTGPVEKISIVDNEFKLYVKGLQFSLSQIMEYHTPGAAATPPAEDTTPDDDSGQESQA